MKAILILLITFISGVINSQVTPKHKPKPVEKEVVVIETKFGEIIIDLFDEVAPKHARNFRKLVKEGFYNGTTFHRVIPGFVIQGGDPFSKDNDRGNDGKGGPGYTLPAEIKMPHKRGFVGAARLPDNINPEKRSNGSQFYICLSDIPHLDGNYTVFGRVIEGMDVVDKIAKVPTDKRNNPIERVEMIKVYLKKMIVK
jgi:cyclophilin family peptidyl-prolyl cis-trans isomerase